MLYWALIGRQPVELVRILVDAGADASAKDSSGRPMLYWALIDSQAVELVRILVDAGANVNAEDRSGRSMLYWATQRGNSEVIQILLDAGATK